MSDNLMTLFIPICMFWQLEGNCFPVSTIQPPSKIWHIKTYSIVTFHHDLFVKINNENENCKRSRGDNFFYIYGLFKSAAGHQHGAAHNGGYAIELFHVHPPKDDRAGVQLAGNLSYPIFCATFPIRLIVLRQRLNPCINRT